MIIVEKKSQFFWLLGVMIMIFGIIIIGGITRLTGSGLSMVDWRPLMGIIPPLSHESWVKTFNLYKSFPQYQLQNATMTLNEFKVIFFWEYLHRIIARVIGLALIIPYLFFLIRGTLSSWLNKRALSMIVLVILQGVMGWYMVKSGLIDNPEVSHFRLASHLMLAFLLLQYILWTVLELSIKKQSQKHWLARWSAWWSIGIIIQIIYGAFTAGKKAGWGYNTYPLMDGSWIPESAFMYPSVVSNILNNPVMIQFLHRHMGVILGLGFFVMAIIIFKDKQTSKGLKIVATIVLSLILIQIILGIMTLVLKVPLVLAVLHQLTGAILLSSITLFNYFLYYKNKHI